MYKSITLFAFALTTVSLTGCFDLIPPGHSGIGSTEDGDLCSETASTAPVYIQIGYGPGGIPIVNPENCHVSPATRITWRGPGGGGASFEIDFKSASAADDGTDQVESKEERTRDGLRQKARITSTSASGTYGYTIKANGVELDPSIIVN